MLKLKLVMVEKIIKEDTTAEDLAKDLDHEMRLRSDWPEVYFSLQLQGTEHMRSALFGNGNGNKPLYSELMKILEERGYGLNRSHTNFEDHQIEIALKRVKHYETPNQLANRNFAAEGAQGRRGRISYHSREKTCRGKIIPPMQ